MASRGQFTVLTTDLQNDTSHSFNLPASAKFLFFVATRTATADTVTQPAAGTDSVISRGMCSTTRAQRCTGAAVTTGVTYQAGVHIAARQHRDDCVVMRVKGVDGTTAGKLSVSDISTSGPNYTVTVRVDEVFDVDMIVDWFALTEAGVSTSIVDIAENATSFGAGVGGKGAILMGATVATLNSTGNYGITLGFGVVEAGATPAQACHVCWVNDWTGSGLIRNRYARSTHGYATGTTGAQNPRYATISSFTDSAATLTWGGAGSPTGGKVSVCLFSGLEVRAGSITTVNSTSTDIQFPAGTTFGWTPFGALATMAGDDRTGENSGGGCMLSHGFLTGQSEVACQIWGAGGTTTSVAVHGHRAGVEWTHDGSGSSTGKLGLKASTGFGDPLLFRETLADPQANLVGLIVFGQNATAPDAPSLVEPHSTGAGKGHAVATQAATGSTPTGIRFYEAPDSSGAPDAANKTQLTPDATPPGAGLTVEHEENALAEGAVWWFGASAVSAGGESAITWAAAALTVHSAPTLAISDPPGTGYVISAGTPLACACTATDADDGDLAASVTWTDSVEGLVYTGGSFALDTTGFTEGAHVMTAAVTDSDGDTADDTFGFTIGSAPAGTSGRREPMIVDGITYGEAVVVNAPLYDADEKTPLTAALSTGDVKISKDGAAKANIATLPAALNADGVTWPIALSATEMQAKEIHVYGPASGSPTPALILRTVGSSGFYDETPVATDSSGAVTAGSLGAQALGDVETAAAAALTAYDPPTKAELDSAQAAVIAGVPDATDVQTAAAAALATYDSPTKAELDAALAALNDLDATAIATAVQTGLTAQGLTSAVITALKVAALAGGGGKSHRATTAVPLTVYDTDGSTPLGTITITKSGGQLLDMEFTPA